MGKPILRPPVHYMKAVYADYAQKMLDAHPEWWGKYEKRLKLRNCYIYAKEGSQVVLKMSWMIWKEAVTRFFHEAKASIIQGETLKLYAYLGRIRAVRIQRNFANPVINWGETHKQRIFGPDGKLVKIYHTDDDYCRIEWDKLAMIPNEQSYCFQPAAKNMETGKGFKQEFNQALTRDPLLKFRFKYYPLTPKKTACSTPTPVSEKSSDRSSVIPV